MNTWIVSDYHLGDDRMKILGRPFDSADVMAETFIKLHNSVVKPEDEVIIVGDVCCNKTLDKISLIERFNGKKTLIRGNHDIGLSDDVLFKYFNVIVPDGKGLNVEVGDIPCYATHYPTSGVEDRFNLVGHVHSAWKYQLNMYNIGVDANHFYPVNLNTIPFHLEAITKFYDSDVWVAYNDINVAYRDKRGKKDKYFKS
jgi:calcineurin-like phosphoesterase family protein